jgi:hypothetical protein
MVEIGLILDESGSTSLPRLRRISGWPKLLMPVFRVRTQSLRYGNGSFDGVLRTKKRYGRSERTASDRVLTQVAVLGSLNALFTSLAGRMLSVDRQPNLFSAKCQASSIWPLPRHLFV